MRCYGCGNIITDEMRFCPECGRPQGFDADLIRRAEGGEQDAITELYNRTYDGVYQTVRAMVKDESTALDILQDSYIKAFKSLGQLNDPDKFGAWMKRIAHNRAVDYLRKTKPVMFSEMVSADSDEMVDFADERISSMPDAVIDRNETARLMGAILDELPDDQRAVTVMHYFDDDPISEIATALGVSENTVKSRLNYARQKIKAKVEALEKQGTKLYGLAPVPFLIFLFRGMEAQAAEAPSQTVWYAIQSECVSAATPNGQMRQPNAQYTQQQTASDLQMQQPNVPYDQWQQAASWQSVSSAPGGAAAAGGTAATGTAAGTAAATVAAASLPVKIIAIAGVVLAVGAAAVCGIATVTATRQTDKSIERDADEDEEDGENESDRSETEAEDGTESVINGIFTEKLDEIVSQNGILEDSQEGTMYAYGDQWFDYRGVMSATILDFDSDGQDEMLVCISEDTEGYEGMGSVNMYMWEYEDGEAVLADNWSRRYVTADNMAEQTTIFNAVPMEGGYYILCETRSSVDSFVTGGGEEYWIMEYADGKIQEIASLDDPGPGGDCMGVEYENGEVVSSQIYYCDSGTDGEVLYDNFDEAFTAFFDLHGIQVNIANANTSGQDSVYEPMLGDAELIFSFRNTMTACTRSNYTVTEAEFETTLKRGNDLLDNYTDSKQNGRSISDASYSMENMTWQDTYRAILRDASVWLEANLLETDSPWFTSEYLAKYPLDWEYVCFDLGNDSVPELILRAYSEQQTAYYWFFVSYDETKGAQIVEQKFTDFRVMLVLWDSQMAWSWYNSYSPDAGLDKIALEGTEIVETGESVTINWQEEDMPETEEIIYYPVGDTEGIDEYQ